MMYDFPYDIPVGTQIVTNEAIEYGRLLQQLEAARDATTLPEQPSAKLALNALLLHLRLKERLSEYQHS